jgi:hypothetical protein
MKRNRITSFVAVAIFLCATGLALAAGKGPVKGAKYTGTSGPGFPLSFRVSSNGKAVDGLAVHFLDTCHPGAGNVAPAFHFRTLMVKSRKFSGSSTDHFGKNVSDALHISGTFDGRKASGKVRDNAHIKSLPNCTETVPFTAQAK